MKLGLPKGIVKDKSLDLIKKLDGTIIGKSQLSFQIGNDIAILLKHRDIPKLIVEDYIDYAITSEEWIIESQNEKNVEIIKKLSWCTTKIQLITKENTDIIKTCVTEFYNISSKYFSGKDVEIYKLSGSTEGSVGILFDSTIDCVETGNTLAENNLQAIDTLLISDLVLIKKLGKEKTEFEERIVELLGE